MAFVPKPNECGLFVNTRSPDKSDFNATIDIECRRCHAISVWWMNGWRKVAKSGAKYISLALKPKGGSGERAHNGSGNSSAGEEDIPF